MKDYYAILNVSRDADISTIKRAYRACAMKCHPDRGGNIADFQQVNEAYAALSDPNTRLEYDMQQSNVDTEIDLDKFNEDQLVNDVVFGVNHGTNTVFLEEKNADINLHVSISFEDSYFGKDLDATYPLLSGKSCTASIRIPSGVCNGEKVQYCGLGDDYDNTIAPGDLNVFIEVLPSSEFYRENNDLVTVVSISPIESMIGTTKCVTHITGEKYEIDIYPGMVTGSTVSIEGLGFAVNEYETPGDFVCNIQIESTPVTNPHIVAQLAAINQQLRKTRSTN